MLPWILCGSIFHSARSQAWNIYSMSNSTIPSNTVWTVEVDPLTNLKWVGTDWGLSSFDGTTWTHYNTSNSGLPHNSIRSLQIDEFGNKWIGMLSGGLAKFDGSTWTVYNTSNSGIPDDFVKAICFDTAGYLWVGTPSGLGRYDWNTWTIWDINNSTMQSHHVTSIAIGSNNIKRIGTLNGGLYYYNDTTFVNYSYWLGTLPENTVTSIDIDNLEKPWVAMSASGITVHLGGPAWNWLHMATCAIASDVITHIQIDDMQNKYICSQDKGFITYIGTNWMNYDSTNSPFPDSWATHSVKDTAGILWIGTLGEGLVRLDESQLNNIEEQTPEDIIIGPIPTPDKFSLYTTGMFRGVKTFYICNTLGDVMMKKEVGGGVTQIDFDISSFSPGYYVLFSQDRKYLFRIIKS